MDHRNKETLITDESIQGCETLILVIGVSVLERKQKQSSFRMEWYEDTSFKRVESHDGFLQDNELFTVEFRIPKHPQ